MRTLSEFGRQVIDEVARRHGVSVDATTNMLDAVIDGKGATAQFRHDEFGGAVQWMRGRATVIPRMEDAALKFRINALCFELSNLVATQPGMVVHTMPDLPKRADASDASASQ